VLPRLLPWLAILSLLALKPNRRASAWWIWLPLTLVVAGCYGLQLVAQGKTNEQTSNALEILWSGPVALAFGLAALWLMAPYLCGCGRFRGFLGILAVLTASIIFSFGASNGWALEWEQIASLLDPRHAAATAHTGLAALPFVVPLVLPAPGLAAAIVLCGLASRRRRHPLELCLWLFLFLLVVWVAVSGLVYGVWWMVATGGVEYAPFLGIGLVVVAVTFATMLPFLILSVATPFFGERLKVLVQVEPEPPPIISASSVRQTGAVAQAS
jgi:hypothetical protein